VCELENLSDQDLWELTIITEAYSSSGDKLESYTNPAITDRIAPVRPGERQNIKLFVSVPGASETATLIKARLGRKLLVRHEPTKRPLDIKVGYETAIPSSLSFELSDFELIKPPPGLRNKIDRLRMIVENNGSAPISTLQVRIERLDESGALIHTQEGNTVWILDGVLRPGQRQPRSIVLLGDTRRQTHSVRVTVIEVKPAVSTML
jgi:hypothetical protein